MKPIIKWPGGRTKELEMIQQLIPSFDRYIEPFIGGGTVYFAIEPEKAQLNDNSVQLMNFYYLVQTQNRELHKLLLSYDRSFRSLIRAVDRYYDSILDVFRSGCSNADIDNRIDSDIDSLIDNLIDSVLDGMTLDSLLISDPSAFRKCIRASVLDKFERLHKSDESFSDAELEESLKAGFTGGFYFYFRDVYNQIALGRIIVSQAYRAANFYFIREFGHGILFRFNGKGEINIPYGGVGRNSKDFSLKIAQLYRDDTRRLLEGASLHCMDFEAFLKSMTLTGRDFLFLDPPADTEKSEYDGRFDETGHRRLASLLKKTPAQFILLADNTDVIRELYSHSRRIHILTFDKNYTCNVRKHFDPAAKRLIITNIPEDDLIMLHLD